MTARNAQLLPQKAEVVSSSPVLTQRRSAAYETFELRPSLHYPESLGNTTMTSDKAAKENAMSEDNQR